MHPADLRSIDPDLADDYARVDWAATPLGAVDAWSAELRHAVDICLHTRYASTLLWGPDLVMVYNAPYAPLIGDKHPAALGLPARDVFPEAWDQIEPLLRGVLDTGEAVFLDNLLIPLRRRGFLEDCYFSFSYSPVHDDDGRVLGVLDVSAETTDEEVSVRRLQRFAELRGALAEVDSPADFAGVLTETFLDDPDLPDLALRLPDEPQVDALPERPEHADLIAGQVVVEADPEGPVAWLRLRTSGIVSIATRRRAVPERPGSPLLVARLNPRLPLTPAYEQYVALIGTALGQTWDRLSVLGLERQVAATEHEVSLTLQRSLLSAPAVVPGIEVAVRYDPAQSHTRIGGDWYDAFLADDGELVLSVGDVAGHDLASISTMGQMRTLLRGLAYRSVDAPGVVMSLLDDILAGLGLDTLASGLLARLGTPDGAGCCSLTWSNAGHPPPLLLGPDGSARLLEVAPQPLLGLVGLPGSGAQRTSEWLELPAGSSLVLYTDGLVERPGRHLDEGLAWLCDVAEGRHENSAEELASALVADLPVALTDDVAVMVVRLGSASADRC